MKTSPKLPTLEQARRALAYDPETGQFAWVAPPKGRKPGQRTGYKCAIGYVSIRFMGRLHYAHRLAWLMTTGKWPEGHLDHINGDPSDNRFCNLRAVTRSENQANRGIPISNKSGYKGVSWSKEKRKWEARIAFKGAQKFIGYFDDRQEASRAYIAKEREVFGEFARKNHGKNVAT